MSIRPVIGGLAGSGSGQLGDLYEIFNGSDLESVVGYDSGVITVPTGEVMTIIQKGSSVIANARFVLEGTAELRITSDLAKASWHYTGTDTFISGQGIRASIFNIELVSTSSPSKFIDTFNCTLVPDGCAIAGFDDLGRLEGTGLTALDVSGARSFFDDFSDGLDLVNMIINSDVPVLTSQRLTGAAIKIRSDIPLPLVSTFVNAITFLRPENSVFRIDPISTENFKMSVSLVQRNGGESLFDTSGGVSGSFTAVADGSVSLGIASVSPNGDGRARFTLSSGDVFVGQIVTISNYITNTDYNDTLVVLDVPVAGTFVVDVDFGTDEAGGQLDSNVLTLTDTGTSITEGASATISTDNALTYDGGENVFNVQANSFQINGVFDGTATGTWDTSPLDQKSPNILAFNNPGAADSAVTAEVSFTGNSAITNIPAAGANVFINAPSFSVTSTERLKTDSDGGVIYFGLEPVPTINDGNVYMEPETATKNLSCQFVNVDSIRVPCTFNAANDAITTDSAHGLNVNDTVTLRYTEGLIDTALRNDIVYYVLSVLSPTEFTVSYTAGGALIPLVGGSSGNTSYAKALLKGSRPQTPIAQNNPRTLVPQAIEFLSTGDIPNVVVSNEEDAVNIKVVNHYYRVK